MNFKLHIFCLSVMVVVIVGVLIYVDKVITPQSSASQKEENHELHWSYKGETGPSNWGDLDPTFAKCKEGVSQSPINIITAKVKEMDDQVDDLKLNYEPTNLTLVNNGHTIQATLGQKNNELTLSGVNFTLQQFHFHSKSEHQLDGKHFPLELHLVHKSSEGKLAVLSVMIKEGEENTAIATFWDKLPKASPNEIHIDDKVLITQLLPESKSYYQYEGSLTTPPCTEGVNWIIFQTPVEMSREQINKFAEIFPVNNRPVQPSGDVEVTK